MNPEETPQQRWAILIKLILALGTYTRGEVAHFFGKRPNILVRWEKGSADIDIFNTETMSRILDVDFCALAEYLYQKRIREITYPENTTPAIFLIFQEKIYCAVEEKWITLISYLNQNGYTQKNLAKEFNITPPSLCLWSTKGIKTISVEAAVSMASLLQIDIQDLVEWLLARRIIRRRLDSHNRLDRLIEEYQIKHQEEDVFKVFLEDFRKYKELINKY